MGIEVNFEGKIALVTGASSGLGARFAKILAQAGAQVVLASRRIDRLKELRAEILKLWKEEKDLEQLVARLSIFSEENNEIKKIK